MSGTVKYEMMILLTEEFNESELKTWAFNYAKTLRKLTSGTPTLGYCQDAGHGLRRD